MYLSLSNWNFGMCRLKKHAYAELPPGENHASQAKSLRPNTRNSVFPRALFKPCSKVVHLLLFMFRVCHAVLSVHCSLVITCWERADLLALLCVMFSCLFVTFSCGVLGQMWYLIVLIPDLCLLLYFYCQRQNGIQ